MFLAPDPMRITDVAVEMVFWLPQYIQNTQMPPEQGSGQERWVRWHLSNILRSQYLSPK